MKNSFVSVVLLLLSCFCSAQNREVSYYNNEWLQVRVSAERAKFAQIVTQNSDTVISEVLNVSNNEVIKRTIYNRQGQIGIWKYRIKDEIQELDYTFKSELNHKRFKPDSVEYKSYFGNDTISIGGFNIFENNDSLKYIAPVIEGGLSITEFISKNIIYPPLEKDCGISGTVYLKFNLKSNGEINLIYIVRGVKGGAGLHREAIRVLKKLKFSKLPVLNSSSSNLCFILPICFKLKG